MRFVTAAYGEKYRRWSKGMLRSFAEFNPDHNIAVYTDDPRFYFDNVVAGGIHATSIFSMEDVESFSNQFTPPNLRWVKLMALGHQFLSGETDVCWIDCDVLITADLSKLIHPGKINAPSYGVGGRMRDCGGGLVVPQENYFTSMLFSIPSLHVYLDFVRLALGSTPMSKAADKREYLLADQPKLNHLIHKHACYDLNESGYEFSFRPWGGHVRRLNAALVGIRYQDRCFFTGEHRIGMLPQLSSTIQQHVDSGFRTVRDDATREKLVGYYA